MDDELPPEVGLEESESSIMNGESPLEIKVEVQEVEVESSNTNGKVSLKRKAKDSTISPPNLNYDKRKRILKGLKSHEVREILKTEPFKFCQDIGLVAKAVKCACKEDMKLMSYPQITDTFMWRCRKNKHNASLSIRKGTLFENSRLSLPDILWVAYMWLYEYSMQSMLHECDHTYSTISEWCATCVRLCREILELKCDPIGGEQKTVEVFECNFIKKKPSKKGSLKWVFCALERDSTSSLLIIMDDKKSGSLLKVLDKYILPGSNLISHNWSTFKNLTSSNFHYLRKEKSITFYDLWSKKRMDTFVEFEFVANQPLAGSSLWHKSVYEESFFEKMYRKSLLYATDAYVAFLKDVALVYKPCDLYVRTASKTDGK